jgi:hypothetical protein
MKGMRSGFVCGVLLTFLLGFQACSQPGWKGSISNEDGVIVIRNPKEPLYKTPVLELKEDLSIGGTGASGDRILSDIRDVVVDDAGSIYVLDWQNSRIQVFDRAGTFLRTIGRKGQGPGELEIPLTMSTVGRSQELAIQQASGRFSFFKTDGTFVRSFVYKGLSSIRGLCDSTGQVYLTEIRPAQEGLRYLYKKVAADGTALATVLDVPIRSGKGYDPFAPIPWFQIGRNDEFVFGFPETYEIRIFGTTAKLKKRILRDYDPVAVTDSERAEQEKAFQGGPFREGGTTFRPSKFHAAYRWFFLSDLGHIFVATFETAPDGKTIHDVFDPEGRFIGRIPLKRIGVGIFDGKYYAREEDAEGYPVLKRYAVTWLVQ